jgi:hypothetical protein
MASNNLKSFSNLFNKIEYSGEEARNIFVRYNLVEKLQSNVDFFENYIISDEDRWDSLAYKFYGSYNLWWVIAVFNDIKDPLEEFQTGQTLKIIKPEFLPNLLVAIRKTKRNL